MRNRRGLPAIIAAWLFLVCPASRSNADDSVEVWVTPTVLAPGGQATVNYEGRFAGKPNLTIHYGFNGWNRVDGVGGLQDEDDNGNKNFYKETAMTRVSGSGFRSTLDIPDAARALHYVFYWNDNGTKRWDNNEGEDYAATVTVPYLGPYLTWNPNTEPDNGVVINYQTATGAPTRVEFGKTPTLGEELQDAVLKHSHHVELTGLDPQTRYYYRVYETGGVPSQVHSFKTSAPDPTAFTFVVAADMQDNGENGRWSDVAKELVTKHSDTAFVLIVGDMPWNDQPGHWWTFFDKGRELLATKVVMPAVGNHDTPGTGSHPDASTFEGLFDLPAGSGSETYYSFRFGTARFFSLNSEVPGQFKKDVGTQYKWMRDQLASVVASDRWVFAYWHIPPYDAGERHYREQGKFRDMTALFDGKVDWVFSGHEHLYQRFKPLRYNARFASSGKYGQGQSEGVGYLIVPPAGNSPADQVIPPDAPARRYRDRLAFPRPSGTEHTVDSQIGFVKVAIEGDAIELRTFGLGTLSDVHDSHVIDSLSYSK